MSCYACGAEAIERCYTCGRLCCAKHGGRSCSVCRSSIQPGDPSPERISETRLPVKSATAWWRPQEADEFVPPACYVCQSLSRAVCSACARTYCAEHAGRNQTCQECGRAADLSIWIVGGFLLAFALIALLGHWMSQH